MQFLTLQNKKATLLFFPPKKCPLQQSGGGSLTTSLSSGRQRVALQLPSGKAEREKKRMFGAGRLGHGQFFLSAQIFSRLHCFVSFSSNTLQSHRGAPGLGALQPGFGSSVSSCLELLWLNY